MASKAFSRRRFVKGAGAGLASGLPPLVEMHGGRI